MGKELKKFVNENKKMVEQLLMNYEQRVHKTSEKTSQNMTDGYFCLLRFNESEPLIKIQDELNKSEQTKKWENHLKKIESNAGKHPRL